MAIWIGACDQAGGDGNILVKLLLNMLLFELLLRLCDIIWVLLRPCFEARCADSSAIRQVKGTHQELHTMRISLVDQGIALQSQYPVEDAQFLNIAVVIATTLLVPDLEVLHEFRFKPRDVLIKP